MTSESLSSLATDIPKLGRRVASTGDEDVLVGAQGQADGHVVRQAQKGKPTDASTYLITSPVWSLNSTTRTPASISHNMQVMSPEEVTIWRSLRKRQQLR